MANLNFQYSPFYLILCLLLGLVFAVVLYYRDKKFLEHKAWLPYILSVFRFLTISLLSFLLLVPMLKSIFEETKNPVIIFAEDKSASITENGNIDTEAIERQISQLKSTLRNDFQVDEYYFSNELGTEIPDSINRKSSNLEKVFTGLEELYINQNVGAVVLATDGIYNEGKNPLYLDNNLAAPLYSIALGDTSKRKDLVLRRALNNKIVFLGDKFSLQIDISAQNCAGENSVLTISQVNDDGTRKQLKSRNISIKENNFFRTEEFVIDANQSGVIRYIARLRNLNGEISTQNNRKDIFIEVLDSRQKILILANAPHPDVSAFKQIIESNKNYEVTRSYISDNDINNEPYDLVLFHNLPSSKNNLSSILTRPNLSKAARLFVLGSQTNQNQFNQIQNAIKLEGNSNSLNDVQAIVSSDFKLFNISETLN